ncbi:hypothetical protein WJ00_02280 [Burkholderia vietnamiensis]|nr:hypothetical protein WJ00_02280 [Burkholderia vietnamiensis]
MYPPASCLAPSLGSGAFFWLLDRGCGDVESFHLVEQPTQARQMNGGQFFGVRDSHFARFGLCKQMVGRRLRHAARDALDSVNRTQHRSAIFIGPVRQRISAAMLLVVHVNAPLHSACLLHAFQLP